eukprot:CAMPEP_0172924940 /NCGR_PEP_ID=MMETSP1075-20121228/212654_1 /TAXON_ID=2916 /ORGANISM="Ceratium fusus, Strain PA161109" /LENGTH=38 /DNA_ID= /DNA_START= /DNA_END= /DNA_ORIENTATION=
MSQHRKEVPLVAHKPSARHTAAQPRFSAIELTKRARCE